MAERRMFAKTIIDSDAFLELPISSQLLYFHLAMRADDEGFINKPKSIMKMVGAKDDDINILFAKKFVIPFESGVVVIKHWKIHNYIRGDRMVETKYKDEKDQLEYDENGAYRLCQSNDRQVSGTCPTQVRLGKDRLDKNSIDNNSRFTPPTLEEVIAYCKERKNNVNPQKFIDFYTAKGWFIGKNKVKDWKACVRTWERDEKKVDVLPTYDNSKNQEMSQEEMDELLRIMGKK